jgi:hypothetical protein
MFKDVRWGHRCGVESGVPGGPRPSGSSGTMALLPRRSRKWSVFPAPRPMYGR